MMWSEAEALIIDLCTAVRRRSPFEDAHERERLLKRAYGFLRKGRQQETKGLRLIRGGKSS